MKRVKEFFLKYYMYFFCTVLMVMPLVYIFTTISKLTYGLVLFVAYILFEVADYVNKKRKTIK